MSKTFGSATVPPDLGAALRRNEAAARTFDALGKTERYGLILRLLKTRTADERAMQLARVVALLEAGTPGS